MVTFITLAKTLLSYKIKLSVLQFIRIHCKLQNKAKKHEKLTWLTGDGAHHHSECHNKLMRVVNANT